jgi:hypothetical protein
MEGVTVFDDKPVVTTERKNGKLYSRAVYKYALISDRDFTVPAFSLRFLDPATGTLKHTASNPVAIEVEGTAAREVLIQKGARPGKKEAGEEPAGASYGWFASGVLAGAILGWLLALTPGLPRWKKVPAAAKSYPHRVQSAKDAKTLLGLVISYVNDPQMKPLIDKLEKLPDRKDFVLLKKEVTILLNAKGVI